MNAPLAVYRDGRFACRECAMYLGRDAILDDNMIYMDVSMRRETERDGLPLRSARRQGRRHPTMTRAAFAAQRTPRLPTVERAAWDNGGRAAFIERDHRHIRDRETWSRAPFLIRCPRCQHVQLIPACDRRVPGPAPHCHLPT